jgi:5-methyltetrahydrofolate--homocysteine methyltransferase
VPPAPKHIGLTSLKNYPLEKLVPLIDWAPFFQTWDLAGKYPDILKDPVVGEAARNVLAEGKAMLDRIVKGRWLTASAVYGLWPANSVGDDIEIYADEKRERVLMTWHNLRQQAEKPSGNPNQCLSDFVAPKDSGVRDYLGAFAVTAGIGIDERVKEFESKQDDYSAIMVKAIADRLAEAFAEHLHHRVRTEFWGFATQEKLTNDELIGEKYQGIRPAPGYPACPDHTEKGALFELLAPDRNAGMTLTESYAMLPTASVSGFYFSHPQSRYFAVGKIERDQVADYAHRKGMDLAQAQRWLAPILNY